MKLCDRCRVSGCLLTYGGKACREARKQECPHDGDEDSCKGSPDAQTCIKCCLEWLREPAEVL